MTDVLNSRPTKCCLLGSLSHTINPESRDPILDLAAAAFLCLSGLARPFSLRLPLRHTHWPVSHGVCLQSQEHIIDSSYFCNSSPLPFPETAKPQTWRNQTLWKQKTTHPSNCLRLKADNLWTLFFFSEKSNWLMVANHSKIKPIFTLSLMENASIASSALEK